MGQSAGLKRQPALDSNPYFDVYLPSIFVQSYRVPGPPHNEFATKEGPSILSKVAPASTLRLLSV